jgi:hypothetical protein
MNSRQPAAFSRQPEMVAWTESRGSRARTTARRRFPSALALTLRALDDEMRPVNATAVDQLLKTPGGSFEHLIH